MEKYDKNGTISYTIGTTLTFELLYRKPELAHRLFISPCQKRDETYAKLISLAEKNHIEVVTNNEKIFRSLSGKDNCMVIAEFSKFSPNLDSHGNHVVLVNPANQGNLGTIIRSCAAFSIDGIAIISPAADIFDPKTIRSSMGAIFDVPFHYYATFEEYQKEMGARSYFPFMLQANLSLDQATRETPYSLIFGNEAKGLPSSFLNVGTPVKIPQSSQIDSLNLDNAVSIGLYVFR